MTKRHSEKLLLQYRFSVRIRITNILHTTKPPHSNSYFHQNPHILNDQKLVSDTNSNQNCKSRTFISRVEFIYNIYIGPKALASLRLELN